MKSLPQTARRRRARFLRRPRPVVALTAPAIFLAAAAIALALAALFPAGRAALPAAQAWEYHSPTYRIASMTCPDAAVYPGTNTWYSHCVRLDTAGAPVEDSQTSWLHEDGVRWEAADAAARAIVADQDGFGHQYGRQIWIPIRSDAAPGAYTFNIQSRARNYDKEPDVTATMTLTVIGPPDTLTARLTTGSDREYAPGDRLIGRAAVRTADGALATFTRDPVRGHGVPASCRDCFWRAADNASAAALEIPEGYLSEGTFRARVAGDAPSGKYRIIVSHPQTGSRTLTFTVAADAAVAPGPEPTPDPGMTRPQLPPGPANYTLAGVDAVYAGGTALYTVIGTAEDGSVPNLEGANARVDVLVDGAGAGSVTLTGLSDPDGAITLNEKGVGTFGFSVAAGTRPTTVSLELVGSLDAAPVIRQLNIGTAPLPALGAPTALTLTAGTGDTAGAVTLRWTPGAHADRHWLAGIKVSDWQAGNYDNIIWTAANSNDTHTVTNLDAGAEYAFTVIAGRLVNGQTEWGSWSPISRITIPTATAP